MLRELIIGLNQTEDIGRDIIDMFIIYPSYYTRMIFDSHIKSNLKCRNISVVLYVQSCLIK
jgi:hypothetical protein